MLLFLRSALFFLWFALTSAIMSIVSLPALLLPKRAIIEVSRSWSRVTLLGLRVFAGLGYEIRGRIPDGPMLIAAKHMSMWDTIALYLILDRPVVVLKRSLMNVPFYGWYIRKAGSIAVARDGSSKDVRPMFRRAREVVNAGQSILIFPEGTRKKPGAPPDYKVGVAGLYSQLNVPCLPVALNSGLFWTGPLGFWKKPGTVVVEFLEPIPAGLKRAQFMAELERRVETATEALLAEGKAELANEDLRNK